MGNKKKRSHNAAHQASSSQSGVQPREIQSHSTNSKMLSQNSSLASDRLDYRDNLKEPPLDKTSYEAAIKAHLDEFQDLSSQQANGSKNGKTNGHSNALPHNMPNLPDVPRMTTEVTSNKSKKRGNTNNAEPQKDRIWNTTTNEERERIKEFWLNLGEEERKSLVKVEKEAVLKKMKEQQKHSCSCSVCGRKRTAIEEELEVLYDAYYEELEQYANQQQFPSQSSLGSSRHVHRPARHSKITEVIGSDDSEGSFIEDDLESDLLTDDDDDLSNDEDYTDDEYEDRAPPEFFKFGNSLTVKGGILTVADDLLRNDGKKFIEMMEQLAERRMQREEEAAMEAREYDEEDDDEYDDDDIDSEDYDDDDEDQDVLTEEQRMAEGRRMFQIFAARMFEQRVLTAYREKVAQERQARLLQELELEDSRERERELKKQKEKEKKKDKKRQQQLKKEEEKQRKEAEKAAEKAAEEAALKAEEERKAEEARVRKEELRLKKEAEKKLADAERARKEEEKRKRLAEEKIKEQKRAEQAAKEKQAKEEALQKEKEAKELAARDQKARQVKVEVQPAQAVNPNNGPRKPSPIPKVASPAVGASPAVPRSQISNKDAPPVLAKASIVAQQAQNSAVVGAPPRVADQKNGPSHVNYTQQPHVQQGQIPIPHSSFASHQHSFPRNAFGHPPSLPVPLPPPGIGSQPIQAHDPFGFNGAQPQNPMFANRPHTQMPLHQLHAPPGVFPTNGRAPTTASPPQRMMPQVRHPNVGPYNNFNGLQTRDEVHNENDMTFNRRNVPAAEPNPMINIGPIGAIGRPAPPRVVSQIPAPIQRPSNGVPQRSRFGFDGKDDVMGSRALLDEDDPVIPTSNLSTSIFSPHTSDTWSSSALNGWSSHRSLSQEEQKYPTPQSSQQQQQQAPPIDRWGSLGAIGAKSVNVQPVSSTSINKPQSNSNSLDSAFINGPASSSTSIPNINNIHHGSTNQGTNLPPKPLGSSTWGF